MANASSTEVELKELGNDFTASSEIINIPWTKEHENILVEWADKATCFRWLHARAHTHYSTANAWFTIPVIIMSTLTGTANFAQDKFPESIKEYVSMCIGGVNILAGILTTVQQFLKIGELNESHRASSISWGKFYRNIKVELSKAPSERIQVTHMLKTSKEEFDRLMETSPAISPKVVKEFKKTFSGGTKTKGALSEKQKAFHLLKKPEICDNLESTSLCVFNEPEEKISSGSAAVLTGIVQGLNTRKRNVIIEEIITTFQTERQRLPTAQEVMSEMDNKVGIETIEKILKNHHNNNEEEETRSPLNDVL